MTYKEIIQSWVHTIRPTAVNGTGKTITTIKYKSLRIDDSQTVYINNQPILTFRDGLFFRSDSAPRTIKVALKELDITQYCINVIDIDNDYIEDLINQIKRVFYDSIMNLRLLSSTAYNYGRYVLSSYNNPRVDFYKKVTFDNYHKILRNFWDRVDYKRCTRSYIMELNDNGIWKDPY